MRKLIGIISIILSLIIISVFFLGKKTKGPQSLNLVINNQIKSFDPAVAFNDDSLLVMGQALETLYQYHYLKRPYEVIPLLADGLPKISDNGKIYTIGIKKNIFYNDPFGVLSEKRELKAQDFVWQIKRLAYAPLKSNGAWLFEGKVKGFNEFRKKVGNDIQKFYDLNIEGIKALDDHTLQIELINPEPNLLYFLAMTFTSPVPIEVIKKYNNDLHAVLIGTGPYYLSTQDEFKYVLLRNKGFHEEYYPSTGDRYANTEKLLSASKKRLPFLEEINFFIISDQLKRWESFQQGEIDILNVPKQFLVHLATPNSKINQDFMDKGVQVKHFSRQTTRWLGFNMNDPVVGGKKNRNLRLAIAHAIDFDKYVEILTNNTNLRANSIFNPSISGYRPQHRLSYEFDLERAKKYFAKTGHRAGELTLTYSTRGSQKIHFEEAEFLQYSLKQIGINLKIEELQFSQFLKKGRNGELQFWTDNWIYDYPDAENLLQLLISKNHPGINKSGFSNIRVDDLYNKLSFTLSKNKRFEIMYEIEKIVEEEIPWIMLMYESTYMVQQKDIQNFRKSFFIRNHFKYIEKFD